MKKTFIYICLCRQVNHQDKGEPMKDALILDGWKEVRFDEEI
jgi:hypothetical protein